MLKVVLALHCLSYLLYPTASLAWGYQGHKVVGSIADQLLNANAKQQVRQILGFDLRTAAPWPDCVKSVVRHDDGSFHYEVDPNHLEYEVPCVHFNSTEERARIVDYAKRNWSTCSYTPDGFERGCHNTFHFENIAIQRNRFFRTFQGTNDHDLVAAIGAAIAVLSDKTVPLPFSIKDKKEALFLLAHLLGDQHQPLHVGAVYLDANGKLVDPDAAHRIDDATTTIGGNAIQDQNISLHHEWDDIPTDIGEAATKELLSDARSLPPAKAAPKHGRGAMTRFLPRRDGSGRPYGERSWPDRPVRGTNGVLALGTTFGGIVLASEFGIDRVGRIYLRFGCRAPAIRSPTQDHAVPSGSRRIKVSALHSAEVSTGSPPSRSARSSAADLPTRTYFMEASLRLTSWKSSVEISLQNAPAAANDKIARRLV